MEENNLGQFDNGQFPYANYGNDNYTAGAYNQLGYSMNGNAQNVFMDWLFPQTKEARQYAMQLEMAENEPKAKMKGLIAAGINPLTAAAGIAGASTGNIPSPSSSTDPIGDIAGAVGSVAGGVGSVAAAYKAIEEGKNVDRLADSTVERNSAEIDKWSHENGYTDAQTEAFNIDNRTRDKLNRAELNIKRQNYRKMVEEARLIDMQRQYVEKQVKWYDEQIAAEIELDKKRALESEKHAYLLEEQTRTEKMENDFAEKYHYRRDQPFDSAMLSLWFEGDYDKVKMAQDFMYDYKYNVAKHETAGEQESISKYAYTIANAQETAKSLNSIITDWNKPASGLWSLIEKSFNVSGNRHGQNNIGSAISAKENPDTYASYSQFVVGLQMSLESINEQISAASAANDLKQIRELTKQRDGLQNFIRKLTYDQYKLHVEAKH